MALNKLGRYIELTEEKNANLQFNVTDVRGISIKKIFIPTKADMDGVPLSSYKVVKPQEFCYVPTTSRNGEKITIAINDSERSYICSSSYVAFRIKDTSKLIPFYLYMYFNRPEFDRYSRFNSWGSARETFSWEDLCEIEINIPSIKIQQKMVAVYLAMVANQKVYEMGLDDLKKTCDLYIENLLKQNRTRIGDLIYEVNEKNDEKINEESGVSIKKEFIKTKAGASDITNQKVVRVGTFAFNSNTSRNSDVISIALNNDFDRIVSNTYICFRTNEKVLSSNYLFLWFKRHEFDRFARFHSWGSARETISLKDISEYEISLPNINVQRAISEIYGVYEKRRDINEQLKNNIKRVCSVLIKGSLE